MQIPPAPSQARPLSVNITGQQAVAAQHVARNSQLPASHPSSVNPNAIQLFSGSHGSSSTKKRLLQFASGDSLPTAQRRNVDGYLPGFGNYVGMQGQAAILGATTSVYSIVSKLEDSDPNKKVLLQLALTKMTSILSVDPEQCSPDEEDNAAPEHQEPVPVTNV